MRVLVVIRVRTETHDRLTAVGARIIRAAINRSPVQGGYGCGCGRSPDRATGPRPRRFGAAARRLTAAMPPTDS